MHKGADQHKIVRGDANQLKNYKIFRNFPSMTSRFEWGAVEGALTSNVAEEAAHARESCMDLTRYLKQICCMR